MPLSHDEALANALAWAKCNMPPVVQTNTMPNTGTGTGTGTTLKAAGTAQNTDRDPPKRGLGASVAPTATGSSEWIVVDGDEAYAECGNDADDGKVMSWEDLGKEDRQSTQGSNNGHDIDRLRSGTKPTMKPMKQASVEVRAEQRTQWAGPAEFDPSDNSSGPAGVITRAGSEL